MVSPQGFGLVYSRHYENAMDLDVRAGFYFNLGFF